MASVTVDQTSGAWIATEHLLELGHEIVFHVARPLDWMQNQHRISGWKAALEAAGAEITMPLAGDWSARSGYEAGRSWPASQAHRGMLGDDLEALGVLLALGERQLSVPEDVSVVGFNNIPEAAYFSPPLTTVHQDFRRRAAKAFSCCSARSRADLPTRSDA